MCAEHDRQLELEKRGHRFVRYADDCNIPIAAAKASDTPFRHRNAAMILLAYRHGLRVSELIGLEWSAINLT